MLFDLPHFAQIEGLGGKACNAYIKRVIGLPGDTVQFIDGEIYLNNNQILKTVKSMNDTLYCGNSKIKVTTFIEKLPDGKTYMASYRSNYLLKVIQFKNNGKTYDE